MSTSLVLVVEFSSRPNQAEKMAQSSLFSSGIDIANVVVMSSDLLQQSWTKNLDPNSDTNLSPSLKYRVYPHGPHQPLGTIVAFGSSPTCTVHHLEGEGRELISSETLRGEAFPYFDFLFTKRTQAFSIHKAAIFLFRSRYDDLLLLKNQLLDVMTNTSTRIIITGHSIGGSIASLFTLFLLESIPPKAKRPLCITFGSPLIGDSGFQQAVLARPTWTSCFLHVASNWDPIPKLFVSTSQNGSYQPFGTFLLCSEFGCACFEEPESVSELLVAMRSDGVGNQDPNNYTWSLECLKSKTICKGSSGLTGLPSTLRGGIITQLEAIGIKNSQSQQWGNDDINALITNIEQRTENLIIQKRSAFDPNKQLNDRKVDMTQLEWYKKVRAGDRGYYDSYKNVLDQIREHIVKNHKKLTLYWKKVVEEADKLPKKEGGSFRTRWLYAGTNYRRMVEPLDIADYYRKGKRDYITQGRSAHYVFLEKWLNDDTNPEVQRNNASVRTAACNLTEDSCFWAHVEEAILSCKSFQARETSPADKESSRVKLKEFDRYAMNLIKNFGVSTEIFLAQSSFMQWWEEYDKIMGTEYNSELIDFIRSGRHQQYA
ncbi:senescence-associated carboxylesterase 101-like isoform X2 [Cornus florida]|uniref:senescence-associated carboxylesterase 101-like isoform X2 n=1 Tax=Cornus florida TaxID=4283 RepID=UPI002897260A|nr:senescence-associated carboxylesterase 101-like isoform X2 [Cornus florida]